MHPFQTLHEAADKQIAAGNFSAAEELYQQMLTQDSRHAPALAGLGSLAGQSGQAERAAGYLEQACALEPENPVYLHNYGESLRQSGQLPQAETVLRKVISIDPGFAPAYLSLIEIVQSARNQALSRQDGQLAAILARESAILSNNMGNAWLDAGNELKAIECYRGSLEFQPDYTMAWSNLGNALRIVGQASEAENACRRAIALNPDFAPAWNNLGNALVDQGETEAGLACYTRAVALSPDSGEALHNIGSGSLMSNLYRDDLSAEQVAEKHRQWGEQYNVFQQPPLREVAGKIRVGFISADFREHSVAYFVEALLEHLDRSAFEVYCYSNHHGENRVTERFKTLAVSWRQVSGMSDAQLCELLGDDRLHLLIDLSGHTEGNRLTALVCKPAPVQAHFIGYPAAIGLPTFDFRITDRHCDPETQDTSLHSEKPIYLPVSQFNYRPRSDAPEVNPLPALENGFITFGSLNNIQKINRSVVSVWSAVLLKIPDSRLLLHHKLLADPGCRGRIKGLFEAFGVGPHRIDFCPASEQHLLRYHGIDIALDTFPYNGATTTCEALWMGVPVLSLAGDRSHGRMGVSILTAAGMESWVAGSVPEYVDIAHGWSNLLEQLGVLRGELRSRMLQSSLCDSRRFADDFGACIRQMVGNCTTTQNHCLIPSPGLRPPSPTGRGD